MRFHLTRRLGLALATLIAAAGAVTLTGCSGDGPVVYEPTAWGPTYSGTVYCGYVYSPLECAGHPGTPMVMPTVHPADDALALALWVHLLTYPSFYHGDYYYDRYIVGAGHTTIINKTTYVNQGRDFDRQWSSEETKYDNGAKYKGPGGKTYTGNKYGSASKYNPSTITRKDNNSKNGNGGTVKDNKGSTGGGTGSNTNQRQNTGGNRTGGGITGGGVRRK
jgi:hypothetical protein